MLIVGTSDQYIKENRCRLEAPTVPCCLFVLGGVKIACYYQNFVVWTSFWLDIFGYAGLRVYNVMFSCATLVTWLAIHVNLCQKLSFLHLLTHYMTTEYRFFIELHENTSSQIVFSFLF